MTLEIPFRQFAHGTVGIDAQVHPWKELTHEDEWKDFLAIIYDPKELPFDLDFSERKVVAITVPTPSYGIPCVVKRIRSVDECLQIEYDLVYDPDRLLGQTCGSASAFISIPQTTTYRNIKTLPPQPLEVSEPSPVGILLDRVHALYSRRRTLCDEVKEKRLKGWLSMGVNEPTAEYERRARSQLRGRLPVAIGDIFHRLEKARAQIPRSQGAISPEADESRKKLEALIIELIAMKRRFLQRLQAVEESVPDMPTEHCRTQVLGIVDDILRLWDEAADCRSQANAIIHEVIGPKI